MQLYHAERYCESVDRDALLKGTPNLKLDWKTSGEEQLNKRGTMINWLVMEVNVHG